MSLSTVHGGAGGVGGADGLGVEALTPTKSVRQSTERESIAAMNERRTFLASESVTSISQLLSNSAAKTENLIVTFVLAKDASNYERRFANKRSVTPR